MSAAPSMGHRWPAIWVGARKRWMLRLVFNGLLQALVACAAGLLVHEAFTRAAAASPNPPKDASVLLALLGVAVCTFLQLALRALERRDAQQLGQHFTRALRESMWAHLMDVAPGSLARSTRGTLALRLTGDLRALRMWVSLGVARTVVCVTVCTACLAGLLWVHPAAGGAVGAAVAVVLGLGAWWGRQTRVAVRDERRAHARLHAHVNERLHQLLWLVSAGQRQRELNRLARLDTRQTAAAVSLSWRLALVRHCGDTAAALAGVALLGVGMHLVQQGALSLPQLTAVLAALGFVSPTLREQGLALAHWQGAAVSRERVQSFFGLGSAMAAPSTEGMPSHALDEPSEPSPALCVTATDPYARQAFGAARWQLHHGELRELSLTPVSMAQTLLHASIGLASWREGQVQVAPSARHAVLLDTAAPLWRGSLRYNLLYHAPRANVTAIEGLLDALGLSNWVAEQPRGLRHRVLEGGVNVPMWVRQRVALARLLLAEPALLLIDETLVPMDAATRRACRRALAAHQARGLAVLWALPAALHDDEATAPRPVAPSITPSTAPARALMAAQPHATRSA